MSGLDPGQLDEIEERITALLEKPWDSGTGRPRELTLREAIIVSPGDTRQNMVGRAGDRVDGHPDRRGPAGLAGGFGDDDVVARAVHPEPAVGPRHADIA